MIETMLCALITVLPDYLFRRFVQGKRIGHEITLFTMWYELRWGLTTCAILALLALFTHNGLFWVAAILVAGFQFPDFAAPLRGIADAIRSLAPQRAPEPPAPQPAQEPQQEH